MLRTNVNVKLFYVYSNKGEILIILENQKFTVRWHYKNKEYYVALGYKFTAFLETFEVKAEDLMPTSHEKVKVLCDKCKQAVFEREYRNYAKEHDEVLGDLCPKCNREKAKATCRQRYGVDWGIQHEQFKQKQKETCLNKYGVEFISQDSDFRDKVKNTVLSKYGVENISQAKEIQEKKAASFYENGTCPTSKPQIELYELLLKNYGNCTLNKRCGKYLLDCALTLDGVDIDVEYDGKYWHTNQEKDDKRDKFILSKGYKVLRIIGNSKVPSFELIDNLIHTLIQGENIIKIDIE